PDASSIMLFGPGVIDDAKQNVASAMSIVSVMTRPLKLQRPAHHMHAFAADVDRALAALHRNADADEARPPHLEPLFDRELERAIASSDFSSANTNGNPTDAITGLCRVVTSSSARSETQAATSFGSTSPSSSSG